MIGVTLLNNLTYKIQFATEITEGTEKNKIIFLNLSCNPVKKTIFYKSNKILFGSSL